MGINCQSYCLHEQTIKPYRCAAMMTILIRKSDRQPVSLGKQIASNCEGEVWETNFSGHLAKIYHDPTPERIEKLKAMLANPPVDPMASKNHISIAFPQDLLIDGGGNCVGFLMPASISSRELPSIYDRKLQTKDAPVFDWQGLHVTALNIVGIVQAIHEKGYVLGDIKPENILVSDRALVTTIDTDSFQVRDSQTGKIYYANLGSESFTPVELLGKKFHPTEQTEIHDRFRLAILIHYLLFGYHPFSGEWTGAGEPPNRTELIRKGFWYGGKNSLIPASRMTIPLDAVHPEIKRLFFKCFSDGHEAPRLRPTAEDWHNALQVAVDDLTICSQVKSHYYSQVYGKCYWCQRALTLGVDIFPHAEGTSGVVADENLESISPATSSSAAITPSITQEQPTAHSSTPSRHTSQQPSTSQSLNNSLSTQSPNRRRPSTSVKPQQLPLRNNKLRNRLLVGAAVLLLGLGSYQPLQSAWLFSAETAPWKKVAVIKTLEGHRDSVEAVAISKDGQIVVSGDRAGIIKVWNLSTGLEVSTIKGHRDSVESVAISPDGQTIVSCGEDNTVKVWNLYAGSEVLTLNGSAHSATSVAISPDGKFLVSSGSDVKVWNLSTGQEIRTIKQREVTSVAITSDGQFIVGGTSDDGIMLWNLATGEKIRTFDESTILFKSVAVSPDGQTIIGGTFSKGIKVLDTSTGKINYLLADPKKSPYYPDINLSAIVDSVAISPDGKFLVSANAAEIIKVWHLPTGQEIRALNAHEFFVNSVAISSDGHTMVSGSGDRTVKVWHIPN